MNNNLSNLQNVILNIGKEIHDICINHNIQYMMQGGTFLGAIRHKGFIPWDDDMDFGMTWDNYKKFIEVLKQLYHPWLSYDIPSVENNSYFKYFIKVYDKRTTFLEWDKNEEARGVFVDIFPIAYGGNTWKETYKMWKKYQLKRALLDRKGYKLHKRFSLKDRSLRLISHVYSHESLVNWGYNFYEKANHNKFAIYSMAFEGTRKDIVKSNYYETPYKLYKFEDTEFFGVEDYDGFLTDIFHDYMTLPPNNQRIPHHYKFLDLNTPYEEYNNKSTIL